MKTAEKTAINKLFRFEDYGVKSFKQLIDEGIFNRSESGRQPKYKWNRRKYNNMYGSEQREYEEKMKETKPVYHLYPIKKAVINGKEYETCQEVSKYVFEYFNRINQRRQTPGKYATKEEMDHLFNKVN